MNRAAGRFGHQINSPDHVWRQPAKQLYEGCCAMPVAACRAAVLPAAAVHHALYPRHRRRRRGCWTTPLPTLMPGGGETLRRPTPSTPLMMPAPLKSMMDSAWSACLMGAPRWGALLAAGNAAYANHRWHPVCWCMASALNCIGCVAGMWVARCCRYTSLLTFERACPLLCSRCGCTSPTPPAGWPLAHRWPRRRRCGGGALGCVFAWVIHPQVHLARAAFVRAAGPVSAAHCLAQPGLGPAQLCCLPAPLPCPPGAHEVDVPAHRRGAHVPQEPG